MIAKKKNKNHRTFPSDIFNQAGKTHLTAFNTFHHFDERRTKRKKIKKELDHQSQKANFLLSLTKMSYLIFKILKHVR